MTLHERLERIFRRIFNNDGLQLSDQTTAADIEGWDSIAHINLMFSIEQEFGIQFLGDEFARFSNVGDLKRSLEMKGLG
jgi:acyl carrier protein